MNCNWEVKHIAEDALQSETAVKKKLFCWEDAFYFIARSILKYVERIKVSVEISSRIVSISDKEHNSLDLFSNKKKKKYTPKCKRKRTILKSQSWRAQRSFQPTIWSTEMLSGHHDALQWRST